MRQLAGTRTRYRRAHAAPLTGPISDRVELWRDFFQLEPRRLLMCFAALLRSAAAALVHYLSTQHTVRDCIHGSGEIRPCECGPDPDW